MRRERQMSAELVRGAGEQVPGFLHIAELSHPEGCARQYER